jgi:uncharacterized membrane protein YgcG
MKKRLLPLCIAAVMLLAPSAFAQDETAAVRVFDNAGLLNAEDVVTLEAAIADFQENSGYDFAILVTDTDNGDADYQQIADAFYKDNSLGLGMNHTAILCYLDLFGDGYYYISVFGDLKNLMVDEDIQYLADKGMEYFTDGDFLGGFTWTIHMLGEALANIGNMNQTTRVYDYAEVLTDEETASLETAIADFRALSGMDFLFLSTYEDLEGNENGDYMTEFYNRHGFGDGENRSGVMIYLDLFNGNYYIQPFGDMNGVVPQESAQAILNGVETLMNDAKIADAVLQVIDAYSAYFR